MLQFLKFGMAYFCVAAILTLTMRQDGLTPLLWVWQSNMVLATLMAKYAVIALVVGTMLAVLTRTGTVGSTIIAALAGAFGALFFQSGFSLIKTSLPYIVPFYADPFFADLDFVLHGGSPPWKLVRQIMGGFPIDRLYVAYLHIWSIAAICLPALVGALDNDAARVRRTIILYVTVWIILGNVFALMGMSAGPVYYDRLLGGERFADLTAALLSDGVVASSIGVVQSELWNIYSEHGQSFGSGISAFPSVHVGIAVVVAIYFWERSRWLLPFGVAFAAIILFLSVYTGYHYAVDGYVSVAFTVAVWRWLLHRDKKDIIRPNHSGALHGAVPGNSAA